MIRAGLGAIAIMLLTWLGFPTAAPIATGLIMGLGWPGRAARMAALAGAAAWGGRLVGVMIDGTSIADASAKVGGAMGIPGWAPLVATVLYPAILAASAAWMGQLVSPRHKTPPAASPIAHARSGA